MVAHEDLERNHFWLIRTGRNGEREEQSLREGIVLPGMDYGEDVNRAKGSTAIKKVMRESCPEIKKGAIPVLAGQLVRFQSEMLLGDLVLMPSKLSPGRIYTGTVSGEYRYRADQPDSECRHTLPVDWNAVHIRRDDLGIDLQKSLNSLQTLSRIDRHNALARVLSVMKGDGDSEKSRYEATQILGSDIPTFDWQEFYAEFAVRLLEFKDDREQLFELLEEAAELSERKKLFKHLFKWGERENQSEAKDIDPFTVLGTINRQITGANKSAICQVFKEVFALEAPVPQNFDAIPQINNQNSRYESRLADIEDGVFHDQVWDLLEKAIRFADTPTNVGARGQFIKAFDETTRDRSIARYTMALFWARPATFLALDKPNAKMLASDLVFGNSAESNVENGADYLDLIEKVQLWLQESIIEPKSLVGFSHAAYVSKSPEVDDLTSEPSGQSKDDQSFTTLNIAKLGCFIEEPEIQKMLTRWEEKKNIILQGPPGTGKTWLARKLAQALCGTDSEETIIAVQFHPSTSYEDFVQGFRPTGEGKLHLEDGPFLKVVQAAKEDEKKKKHVVVIEEINRGNPAQIFGEMLTLLEADKRGPGNELVTLYGTDEDKLFLPENLYVIGTMNQADRSLALVDMALRRRFSFITLAPQLGRKWQEFCATERNRDPETLRLIGLFTI